MIYAPVLILVYDRIEHLKRCLKSLLMNKEAKNTVVYIASDAAYRNDDINKIVSIRQFILGISGFKKIVPLFWETNKGAHLSEALAIKEIFKDFDRFVFLEDDIVVSSDFLNYMNTGLEYYRDDKRVFSICGFKAQFVLPVEYDKDVYFYPCNSPWGFATWKNRWENVNLDYYDRYRELKKNKEKYKAFSSIGFYIKGILQADSRKEIEAGDLRIYYHMFQNNMCSVFPIVSKTQNWGFDGSGEHCGNKNYWWAKPKLDIRNQPTRFVMFESYDEKLLNIHRKFQDKINGGWLAKYLKYTWVHGIWKWIRKNCFL